MKSLALFWLVVSLRMISAAEAGPGDWEKLAPKLGVDFVQRLARSGETNARAMAVDEALSRAAAFREFYEKSPTSEHTGGARRAERAFLSHAAGYGSTNANALFQKRLEAAVAKAGADRRAKLELADELAQHRVHLQVDLQDPVAIDAVSAAKADAVVDAGRKLAAEFPTELAAYERWLGDDGGELRDLLDTVFRSLENGLTA